MRKLAVCGKGGSGKSSLVALLAHGLHAHGYQILVVDSDESNPGLARKLGMLERPAPLLELVGGKKNVFPAFSEGAVPLSNVLTQEQIRISDLPPAYVAERQGIRMVSVGKIYQSLEGCACPMGALSREFLGRLVLQDDEIALVDMEAGVESFGRGVEGSVDHVLVVVEPSFDSLELASQIQRMAREVQVRSTWTIINKVMSDSLNQTMTQNLAEKGLRVLGSIRYDQELMHAGLDGSPIAGGQAAADMAPVVDRILAEIESP